MSSEAQRQRMNFFIWSSVLLFSVFMGISLGLVMGLTNISQDMITPGVYIQGIDVGGKTISQAKDLLHKELDNTFINENLSLDWQGRDWTLSPPMIEARLDLDEGIREAMGVGRGKGFFKDLYHRYLAKTQGTDINLKLTLNEGKLNSFLTDLSKNIDKEPIDAQILVNDDDTLKIIGDQPGQKLNLAKAQKEVKKAILGREKDFILPVEIWPPQVSAKSLHDRGINRLLASMSTSFSTSKANRAYNIYVAAKAIDGIMLKPGEVFSFNKIVGPRSQEAGYKMAGVIVNNQLVDGLGGGVCQVSSTLYNAVLLADLEIVQRSNHSKPVSYLPLGQDATVAYDYLDFKFKNSTSHYILLKAETEGGKLKIRIFGGSSPEKQVRVYSTVVGSADGKLKVDTWRTVEMKGSIVRKELVSHSNYNEE